ncbi:MULTISPECIES: energy transducer TonB [unclassified Acinetobacter]|uniref:energy transducer TonB n=1 Tax=unclassified Acinetobacter TaxID=196816 RepID=UPI0015D26FA7|nr:MULTISPECIES: energy transducer TonB [unclassified Acinetobacter]
MKKILCLSFIVLLQILTALYAQSPSEVAKQHVITLDQMIWQKRPIFNFNNDDLGNQNRDLSFKLYVLATGEVQKAELIKSSGLTHIDKRVEQSLLRAKFKPYIENGVAYPFVALQPFSLKTLKENQRPWWKKLLFIS